MEVKDIDNPVFFQKYEQHSRILTIILSGVFVATHKWQGIDLLFNIIVAGITVLQLIALYLKSKDIIVIGSHYIVSIISAYIFLQIDSSQIMLKLTFLAFTLFFFSAPKIIMLKVYSYKGISNISLQLIILCYFLIIKDFNSYLFIDYLLISFFTILFLFEKDSLYYKIFIIISLYTTSLIFKHHLDSNTIYINAIIIYHLVLTLKELRGDFYARDGGFFAHVMLSILHLAATILLLYKPIIIIWFYSMYALISGVIFVFAACLSFLTKVVVQNRKRKDKINTKRGNDNLIEINKKIAAYTLHNIKNQAVSIQALLSNITPENITSDDIIVLKDFTNQIVTSYTAFEKDSNLYEAQEFQVKELFAILERCEKLLLKSNQIKLYINYQFNEDDLVIRKPFHLLYMVIHNLFTNSVKALETSDVKEIFINVTSTENTLSIAFADTGCGLDKTTAAILNQYNKKQHKTIEKSPYSILHQWKSLIEDANLHFINRKKIG